MTFSVVAIDEELDVRDQIPTLRKVPHRIAFCVIMWNQISTWAVRASVENWIGKAPLTRARKSRFLRLTEVALCLRLVASVELFGYFVRLSGWHANPYRCPPAWI